MSLAIACDHAGLSLKSALVESLKAAGTPHEDLGVFSGESVDYPDYALQVAEKVKSGAASLGLLVCGTGIGMSIAANKVVGVRAALCHTEFEARMARAHNDANVLCLGERVTGQGVAKGILEVFLATAFEGGRHANRVHKLTLMERSSDETTDPGEALNAVAP